MTISKKLYASFGAALAFTLILGITSWTSLTRIGTQVKISSSSTYKLELAGEAEALTANMLSTERGMTVRTLLKDQDKVEEYNSQFRDYIAKRQEILKEDKSLATSENARQLIQEMLDSYEQRIQGHDSLYRLAKAGDGV